MSVSKTSFICDTKEVILIINVSKLLILVLAKIYVLMKHARIVLLDKQPNLQVSNLEPWWVERWRCAEERR